MVRAYDGFRLVNDSYKDEAMKRVETQQRLGAVAMALGITFSIVWALSSYAYAKPAETELSPAAKLVALKSCS